MKNCKCGNEIREDQTICFNCYKKANNFRHIRRDEIVLDCDDKVNGDLILGRIGLLMSYDNYKFEVWRTEGGKSYHIHIKNIPHIKKLEDKQNELYKILLIKRYMQKVKDFLGYEPEGLNKIDFSVCQVEHLIAEEGKLHFKYKKQKQLIGIINEDKNNYCDREIYSEVIKEKKEYKPLNQGTGITSKLIQEISIIDIAKQYGLEVQGNKCLCPFHPDNDTPSLVFYESQGRFCCFGCQEKGNLIKFYVMLKGLKPSFVYSKK